MDFLSILLISSAVSLSGSSPVNCNFTSETGKEYSSVSPANVSLDKEEQEALEFLYRYMPLPDRAGHDADFHLQNLKATFKARREMPWGQRVPEREFRHFMLPVRVNNEVLDLSRPAFYEMLADRVRGLSMKEAILEVNHWCHEHVTYRPSDGRTSPPLSTMSQAIGRCGEESTFTVAALRAVGIPARQVYTPRWAHTDDNHAWVEAWADGQWYFLGACEPAPVLDMAWFNAPASRGMLMTTNVFGDYDGPEEQLSADDLYTTINVTEKYAPVGNLSVLVTDENGKPVVDADVAYCIYNYTEFSPVAMKKTDSDGRSSLTTGIGDAVIWATDGTKFGFAKGRPGTESPVIVQLNLNPESSLSFDMTLVPPVSRSSSPSPSEELIAENDRRLQYEDSIRKSYEATFINPVEAKSIARAIAPSGYEGRLESILTDSRGNSRKLESFIMSLPETDRASAISILEAVTEKDRRDIPTEVLDDCLTVINSGNGEKLPEISDELLFECVLSPRIETEPLVPFRRHILSSLSKEVKDSLRHNPQAVTAWVRDNIKVETSSNPKFVRMDPRTVFDTRVCDPDSRDIFYVALSRTMDIPSRLDPVTGNVQFYDLQSQAWRDVTIDSEEKNDSDGSRKGHINLEYKQTGRIENPAYYTQFSISRIDNGMARQLEFEDEDGVNELNSKNEAFEPGQYMLTTGQRMADGSVLVHGEIFNLKDGGDITVPVIMRSDPNGVQVIGSLNAENRYLPDGESSPRSILSQTGRGYYVLGICRPGHEPSAHALNDLSASRSDLDKWGGKIVVLFPDSDAASRFDRSLHGEFPRNLSFGVDCDSVSFNELKDSLNLESSELPVFVVADTFNRVVDVIQGYSIGLGERLLDTLSKIESKDK